MGSQCWQLHTEQGELGSASEVPGPGSRRHTQECGMPPLYLGHLVPAAW